MTDTRAEATATGFDFSAPAEVYTGRGVSRRHGLRFRQFGSAAEAIRFVMEQPRAHDEIAMMECEDKRYSNAELATLYQDPAYPFERAPRDEVAPRSSIAVATPATRRAVAERAHQPVVVEAAAAPPVAGHRHKYTVGTRLHMQGNQMTRRGSSCSVVFVLPYEGGQVLYRVKSDLEGFERVVPEIDLSPLVDVA